jgi:GMP reductase
MNYGEGFDFDDINLIPRKGIVDTRKECDTTVSFGPHKFEIPVIPANMETVIDEDLAFKLAEAGYFYCMHRFGVDNISFVRNMKYSKNLPASISIGVNQDSIDLIKKLKSFKLQPDYITIDIAHGHSVKMERMIKHIKDNLPETFLIAGNISTVDAVYELETWGADALKVGIAPGSVCTTKLVTGFGSYNKQASVIAECADNANVPIIADGGIRHPGDIAKAMVMGASMVMIGGMLGGFLDSPGNIIEHQHIKYKEFYGSASEHQSNKKNFIEGKHSLIELKDMYLITYLEYLKECLQSAISYAGGNNISSFLEVDFF